MDNEEVILTQEGYDKIEETLEDIAHMEEEKANEEN